MIVPASIRTRIDSALGVIASDMVIRGGTLMDVYTGRMLPGRFVAIKDGWITYVGPEGEHCIGKETKVIDAGGRVLCPGYIDAHTHLITYWNMADFLSYAIPCGVTTLVTESESYAFVAGAVGFRAFLDQIRDRPINIFALIPPMVCLSPSLAPRLITAQEVREFLEDPNVIGLGESFWQGTIAADEKRILELITATLEAGGSVEGHGAGAYDRKLAAYIATGVQSCHEAVSTDDVLSRLEHGLYAMIREGDIRRDLDIIAPLRGAIDIRRLILVTDGTNPGLLKDRGYLVDVIQRAVDMGFRPVEAVQMVTLNPAEHFGLDHLTGGIAPGRLADILILPEEGIMMPDVVISRGRIVAERGEVRADLVYRPYPEFLLNTVSVEPVSPSDLAIAANDRGAGVLLRTIDIQPGGLVTKEGKAAPKIEGGNFVPDPERDLLKIVFIERVSGEGKRFAGFIRGWGLKEGAVATTLCWDSAAIVAVGANDTDMALAINRVIELHGGTVLWVGDRARVEIPFEVGGFISTLKIPDLAARMDSFKKAVKGLGCKLPFAHLTLNVLTTAAIPFIRMTEKGYYRFKENDYAPLVSQEPLSPKV